MVGVAIQESGYYYINKMARMTILTIEETIGAEAMQAIYRQSEVPLTYYPPADNFAKGFDFAYFAALNETIERLYGPRGARGLLVHAGRAGFTVGFAEFSGIMGAGELAFKAISLESKIKVGLRAVAETFSKFSDQPTTVEETNDYFIYTIQRCPVCWGRHSDRPVCHIALGVLDESMHWISGGKSFFIEEVACIAMGAAACSFHIHKQPVGQS